ncbi:MAG: flagellin FliC [Rickettsiales bacterium]|nr:flagellin FliC [Rickettsiales bacterium]|tara:strand:- start:1657 stop:2490 length:834 start_codon:yes stop_codon:yes gene_type:complete
MTLRINNNISSVFAQKHLSRTQKRLDASYDHLSSGMRITRASDDAAGLGMSESMRANIRSLKQAMRNQNDGISMIQTAEGSLSEVANNLMRMRQLAVQSSSDVITNTERAYIQTEFAALQTEVDRIANSTEFNGLFLSNGITTSVVVQVGINNVAANDRVTINMQNVTTTNLAIQGAVCSVGTSANARTAIGLLDTALTSVNTSRSAYGAAQNAITSALHNTESYTENLIASESRIRDVDFAAETSELTRNSVFQQAGIAVLAQANQTSQAALQLLQ